MKYENNFISQKKLESYIKTLEMKYENDFISQMQCLGSVCYFRSLCMYSQKLFNLLKCLLNWLDAKCN